MKPPVILGGAPRSGLTLVRLLLGRHPAFVAAPELGLLPAISGQWQDVARTLGANLAAHYGLPEPVLKDAYVRLVHDLLAPVAAAGSGRRVIDRGFAYGPAFAGLHQLLPGAPLVHVIRDGRAVAASLLRTGWTDASGQPAAYTRDPVVGARLWAHLVTTTRQAGQQCGEHYIELRYEELARAPTPTLKRLVTALGETWAGNLLDFHRHLPPLSLTEQSSLPRLGKSIGTDRIDAWRRTLPPGQVVAVERAIGPTLAAFGYR